MTLTDYSKLTPEERFAELDRLATHLFGTARWKTEFAGRYGISRQAVSLWSTAGPPQWALEAVRDAIDAKKLEAVRDAVRKADQ